MWSGRNLPLSSDCRISGRFLPFLNKYTQLAAESDRDIHSTATFASLPCLLFLCCWSPRLPASFFISDAHMVVCPEPSRQELGSQSEITSAQLQAGAVSGSTYYGVNQLRANESYRMLCGPIQVSRPLLQDLDWQAFLRQHSWLQADNFAWQLACREWEALD